MLSNLCAMFVKKRIFWARHELFRVLENDALRAQFKVLAQDMAELARLYDAYMESASEDEQRVIYVSLLKCAAQFGYDAVDFKGSGVFLSVFMSFSWLRFRVLSTMSFQKIWMRSIRTLQKFNIAVSKLQATTCILRQPSQIRMLTDWLPVLKILDWHLSARSARFPVHCRRILLRRLLRCILTFLNILIGFMRNMRAFSMTGL